MKKLVLKIVGLASGSAVATVLMSSAVMAQTYDYNSLYTTTAADSAAAAGFYGVSALVWVCCCGLLLIPLLVIAYLVYKDAVKNEVSNPILWGLLSFFTGLIGILVYLLAIRPEAIKVKEAKGDSTMPPAPAM